MSILKILGLNLGSSFERVGKLMARAGETLGKEAGGAGKAVKETETGLKMADPLLQDTVSFNNIVDNENILKQIKQLKKQLKKEKNPIVRDNINENIKALENSIRDDAVNTTATRDISKTVKPEDQNKGITEHVGNKIYKEEEGPQEEILKYKKNQSKKFYYVTTTGRLKSGKSMSLKTKNKKYQHIENKKGVRNDMYDLHGYKETFLPATSKEQVDAYLDSIILDIKSGKLELIEVERKRPAIIDYCKKYNLFEDEEMLAIYDYGSPKKIEEMIGAQEAKWKFRKKVQGGLDKEGREFTHVDYTSSNYTANHFTFKIQGKTFTVRFFEDQMMGDFMNKVKHVDDIVYKALDNKPLPEYYKEAETIVKTLAGEKIEVYEHYRSICMLMERIKECILATPKKQMSKAVKQHKLILDTIVRKRYLELKEKSVIPISDAEWERLIREEEKHLYSHLDDFVKTGTNRGFVTADIYGLESKYDYNNLRKVVAKCDKEHADAKKAAIAAEEEKRAIQITEERKKEAASRKQKDKAEQQKRYEARMAKEEEKYHTKQKI